MWKLWKTYFWGVHDKHAPKKVKKLRKKTNIPWVNADVKEKLFKRDFLKRKAIKTNKEEDWLLFKSFRNAANIALRHNKRSIIPGNLVTINRIRKKPGEL